MNGLKLPTPFMGIKLPVSPVRTPTRIWPQERPPVMPGGSVKQPGAAGGAGAGIQIPGQQVPGNAEDILKDPKNPLFWKTAQQVIASKEYKDFWLKKDDAIPALTEIGTEQAIKLIVMALGDADPGIRELAANCLGTLQTADALRLVTEAAAGKNDIVRQYALWALGQMHNIETIPVFIANLTYPNPLVQEQAARSIAMTKDGEAAVGALGAAAAAKDNAKKTALRVAVTEALAAIGGANATAILKAMTSDNDPEVRAAALIALAQTDKDSYLQQLPLAVKDKAPQPRVAALLSAWSLFDGEVKKGAYDGATINALLQTIANLFDDGEFAVKARAVDTVRRLVRFIRKQQPLSQELIATVTWIVNKLIGQMQKEQSARFQAEIVDLLRDMTGVDIGKNVAQWVTWWQEAQKTGKFVPFQAPEAVTQPEFATVAKELPRVFGIPVTATNIAIVLDFSGGTLDRPLALYSRDGTLVDGNISQKAADAYKKVKENYGAYTERLPSKADEVLDSLYATIDAMPIGSDVTVIIMNTEAVGQNVRRFGKKILTAADRKSLKDLIAKCKGKLEKLTRGRKDMTAIAEALKLPVEAIYVWTSGGFTSGDYLIWENIHDYLTRLNRYRGVSINMIPYGGGNRPDMEKFSDENMGICQP